MMFLMFLNVIKIRHKQNAKAMRLKSIRTPQNLNPLVAEIQIATLSRYSCFANV